MTRLRAPVLVIAPATPWVALLPGQRVRSTARLAPAAGSDMIGALVLPRGPPRDVHAAGRVQRGAGAVRGALKRAVGPLPAGTAGLLPGLVIGDTSGLSPPVVAAFRATGLTHLVAVSGANLAIIIGTAVAVTRRLGAGRRLAGALAALAMVGFVVVARPSPSVLRAAVMGFVVLAGGQSGRRSAALPALAAATLGLVLLDPSLARAPGFTLSVLATAGIVLLAGPLQQWMPGWIPDWLAAAVAVPVAAQVACVPVLVGLFGQLSLVAVPANVLAAPAVAPATVIGVAVAAVAVALPPAAALLAWLAVPPTGWLLLVAHWGAAMPAAQVGWPRGVPGAVLVLATTGAGGLVLRQRRWWPVSSVAAVAALVTAATLTWVAPAWPPPGWALTACDVGQGDALVLAAGRGAGVVVDAGPDSAALDRCLRQLRIRTVPLVILTHLHADHVEGLPGLLRKRRVGAIEVGPLDEPAGEAARVRRWAARSQIPLLRAADGERRAVGSLTWQVLAPRHAFVGTDSDPNNSSIVMRVRLAGFTALLTGDIELEAQRELLASGQDISADVLKVPHHGSGRQLPELLDRVGERLAVVSVGARNDYRHPAAATMSRLAQRGAHTFRTDRDGSVSFFSRDGTVGALGRRGVGTAAHSRHRLGIGAAAPVSAGPAVGDGGRTAPTDEGPQRRRGGTAHAPSPVGHARAPPWGDMLSLCRIRCPA